MWIWLQVLQFCHFTENVNVWPLPHNATLFIFLFTFICQMWKNNDYILHYNVIYMCCSNNEYRLWSILHSARIYQVTTKLLSNWHSKSLDFASHLLFFFILGDFVSLVFIFFIFPMNKQIRLSSLLFPSCKNYEWNCFIHLCYIQVSTWKNHPCTLFLNCNTFEIIFPNITFKGLKRINWSRQFLTLYMLPLKILSVLEDMGKRKWKIIKGQFLCLRKRPCTILTERKDLILFHSILQRTAKDHF